MRKGPGFCAEFLTNAVVVNAPLTGNRYSNAMYRYARTKGACGVALVKSTGGDILTGLGDRPGADMAARLLLALTALYVQRPTHTLEEQQQYTELAQRLIDKVDAATLATVAGILQRHPDAPPEVFERLGSERSPRNGEPQSPPDAPRDQTPGDGDASAMTAAPAPAAAAAPRTSAPAEFGEAFFAAAHAERRRLLCLMTPNGSERDIPALSEEGEYDFDELDAAALEGRIGEFTREFERLLAIPKSLCERILNDRSGEPMVVAAKAANMPIAILQRILLLVNPAVSHSVQRVYDLTELYHGLDRGAARHLLAQWRTQAKPNEPAPETKPVPGHRTSGGLRDTSVASLRSRFGALTERLQDQAVNAPPGPGSVARRGLRSR